MHARVGGIWRHRGPIHLQRANADGPPPLGVEVELTCTLSDDDVASACEISCDVASCSNKRAPALCAHDARRVGRADRRRRRPRPKKRSHRCSQPQPVGELVRGLPPRPPALSESDLGVLHTLASLDTAGGHQLSNELCSKRLRYSRIGLAPASTVDDEVAMVLERCGHRGVLPRSRRTQCEALRANLERCAADQSEKSRAARTSPGRNAGAH